MITQVIISKNQNGSKNLKVSISKNFDRIEIYVSDYFDQVTGNISAKTAREIAEILLKLADSIDLQ